MFWGLIMEPNKKYTQTVDKSFHVSMASLDHGRSGTVPVQVLLTFEGSSYLLCTLDKSSTLQVPLDLNFEEGSEIAFCCNGQGNVHLTGYLITDDDTLDEEESDWDQIAAQMNKKRKAGSLEADKSGKRLKSALALDEDESDDEDDDELDSTAQDDSDDLEADEDDSEDEESEEEEEPEKPVAPKKQKSQTPDISNNKQKKQNDKQQKMVNGSETKQETQTSKKKKNQKEQKPQANEQQQAQKKKTLEGGVKIEDLKIGEGAPAKPGKFVSVYYVGRLNNGKKFDATSQGEGFKFRLGRGEVIKGWDIGISGMKVGGKRRLIIPPALAYGAKGSPPVIPGNSQLTFEVELKNVH